jgi:gamma-glutamyltranspeptidase/glutathione hydrolase
LTRVRQAALASNAVAQKAAEDQLAASGSALAAVLSGYFAAAGASSGVLLGPMAVLVGGVGQGARAFDGRLRQPGLGARRPRGFPPESQVPEAASVAVPTSPFAAIVAHAYGAGASLSAVIRPGVDAAERAGAPQRARFLERLAAVGAAAMSEPSFRRPFLHAGSTSEGGLVTPSDLEPPPDVDLAASEVQLEDDRWLSAPWTSASSAGVLVGGGGGICAADAHGVFAALCYRSVDSGAWLEELGLLAHLSAVPVLRGVPRLAPGTRLGAPFPAALRVDASARPVEVVLEPEGLLLNPKQPQPPRLTMRRDSSTRLVSTARG